MEHPVAKNAVANKTAILIGTSFLIGTAFLGFPSCAAGR
jgi:hypothetical protein